MPRRSRRVIRKLAWTVVLICIGFFIAGTAVWFRDPAAISKETLDFLGDQTPGTNAQFELTKIYVQAIITFLTSLFFASGAYIVVTDSQKVSARRQLDMAKLKLIAELDAEIRDVFNKPAIYDAGAGANPVKPRSFVFGLDSKTVWRAEKSDWNHTFGERTTKFVNTSTVLGGEAEVSVGVLHDYLAWVRRVKLGFDLEILDWSDIQIYWRNIVSLGSGNRFVFMCGIFSSEDMCDFAFLVDGLISFGDEKVRRNLARYIGPPAHQAMLEAIGR